jgi:hypothetical protein
MFDDTNVSLMPTAAAEAGYVGGRWPTYNELKAKFPNARLLGIAVTASEDAECLDVENGDATIAQIYGWFKRQQARKVYRPVIYSSVSQMNAIHATMTANGFARSEYRLWSAHYGAGQHICGPSSCKLTSVACDGTQWTSTAMGKSLDESLLSADFFPALSKSDPKPKPPAPKQIPPQQVDGAWRQVSNGTQSLNDVAKARKTTVWHLTETSYQHLDDANKLQFAMYLAWPGRDGKMPNGLVYYTVNK